MRRKRHQTLETEIIKIEVLEGIQRALDRKYRQFLAAARADWERLFKVGDSSDACVAVQIDSEPDATYSKPTARAGYLPKPPTQPNGKTRRRLA